MDIGSGSGTRASTLRAGFSCERGRRYDLPTLSAEDRTDLGVTLVGHRRRLLDELQASRAARAPRREKIQKGFQYQAQRMAPRD